MNRVALIVDINTTQRKKRAATNQVTRRNCTPPILAEPCPNVKSGRALTVSLYIACPDLLGALQDCLYLLDAFPLKG